jgi:hypothetical protein
MVEHYLSSPAHRRGQGVHHTGVRPNLSAVIVALCMSIGFGGGGASAGSDAVATDSGLHLIGWVIAALGAVMCLGLVFAKKMPPKVRA